MSESNGILAGVPAIPLDAIQASPDNPRKHVDQAKLAELAASIKEKGVLQPVLVRPLPLDAITRKDRANKGKPTELYELVAGHRRVSAARLAGLAEIPAVVRELTDLQAAECRLIENDQREDLSPLERAEGYRRLLDEHGYAVEDLAAKVGKSPSTIRGLLKLVSLPKKAAKALAEGALSVSVAQLIGRIPSPKAREEAAAALVGVGGDGGPGYRWAKEQIEQRWMLELKQAPFSQKDAALLPGAGACTACPKRTGNNRDDYPDGRADVCTDPGCYQDKVKAHEKRLLEAARESGKQVLSGKEAKGLFDEWNNHLTRGAAYVDLAATCYEVAGVKTWGKLVGKRLAADTVVAVDPKGGVHELVPRAKALKVLREEHGVKTTSPASSEFDTRWKAEQAAVRRKAEAGKEAARRANGLVAEAARAALADGPAGGRVPIYLRALVPVLADAVWADACRLVARRRGLEGDPRDAVAALANQLDGAAELFGLAAELLAARRSAPWGGSYSEGPKESKDRFWETFGVDPRQVFKEAEAERKQAKAAKKAGKAKAAANGQAGAAALEDALGRALRATEGADERRWDKLRKAGAADAELLEAVGEEWAGGPSYAGTGCHYSTRGGSRPAFWFDARDVTAPFGKPTLQGKALAAAVRGVLKIPPPAPGTKLGRPAADVPPSPPAEPGPERIDAPITRTTALIDLLTGKDVSKAGRALEDWHPGVPTVGTLLERCGPAARGESYTSKLYTYLRGIPGLGTKAANEIGDALVDAGLIGPDGPTAAASPLASKGPGHFAGPAAHWRELAVEVLPVMSSVHQALRAAGMATLGQVSDRVGAIDGYKGVGPFAAATIRNELAIKAGAAGEPAGPSCRRCGCSGGAEVDMPSQADADDDLIPADVIDVGVLLAAGLEPDQGPETQSYLCAKCHAELLNGGTKSRANKRKVGAR